MEGKKVSPLYRVVFWLIKLFTPKYELKGTENIPGEPCIIVGNHCQIYGPVAAEIYMTGKHCTWCAGEMMHREEVPAYAYKDFWSKKPASIRWFYKLLSYLITPLALLLFNNANTIAVYHDARLISTFRDSIELLQKGYSIVIFPECYDEYNNIIHEFQDKFIDLARFYYRKTKTPLQFLPLYIAPRLGTMSFGKPIRFQPEEAIENERKRICAELKEEITRLAVTQPEHIVVPYPNIPKRDYPKNIPLEVYTHEETAL